jgi:hypothetical protein
MVQRYAHLSPDHIRAAVEHLVEGLPSAQPALPRSERTRQRTVAKNLPVVAEGWRGGGGRTRTCDTGLMRLASGRRRAHNRAGLQGGVSRRPWLPGALGGPSWAAVAITLAITAGPRRAGSSRARASDARRLAPYLYSVQRSGAGGVG